MMKQVNPVMLIIVSAVILLGVSGCDTFELAEQYQSTSVQSTGFTISPAFAVVGPDEAVAFTALGGAPPYEFSLSESAAGTIDEQSGDYIASQNEGEYSVTVTDSTGSSTDAGVFVTLPREYSLSPSVLTLEPGDEYEFSVYGGTAPYEFTVVVGAIGTFDPDTPGLFVAGQDPADGTVRVTDSDGRTVSSNVYVREAGSMTLALAVEAGSTEQEKAVRLFPRGGEPPYSYSLNTDTTVHSDEVSGVGYIVENSYEPGDFIGTVVITVRDSDGAAANHAVKVLPSIPADVVVTAIGGRDVELTWEYTTAGVTRFRVERRDGLDTAFQDVSDPGVSAAAPVEGTYTFTDLNLTPNQFYEYRLFAVTGNTEYDSPPTTSETVKVIN